MYASYDEEKEDGQGERVAAGQGSSREAVHAGVVK